ncbi:MAG: tRNA pseudouridine(55) synthase TruB [Xanthomonadales bacterium]|nr:tRNA pseudouridine(55) synthase TruB [Xanthomonadales bacterium]
MSRPRRPPSRNVHGIVLLDKPIGLSSNQALQRVKWLFNAAKAGHTGSLDPLATGLLPICLGEATKIAGLLLGSEKAYRTTARLGVTTDTDDADGEVLRERPLPELDEPTVREALKPLIGRIQQRPPIYSALKQGGEALYRKARRGEVIEVPTREVQVRRIDLLRLDGNQLELQVECGSGTYIRSLVRDLGESLGCGAHVSVLRRLWVSPFSHPEMWTLEQLGQLAKRGEKALDGCILPISEGLRGFPALSLDAEQARRLGHGQALRGDWADGLSVAEGPDGVLLGLVEVAEGQLRARRLFSWAAAGSV